MSWKISGLVWELDLTHSQQSVLLAMADHAEHDGSKVFPSVARIAWKTSYSERQVRRVMSKLRGLKILVIVKEANRYRPREYKIDISAGKTKKAFRDDIVSSLGDEEDSTPTSRTDTDVTPEASELIPISTRDDIATSTRPDTAMSTRPDIAVSSDSSLTIKEPSLKRLKDSLSFSQDDWIQALTAIKQDYYRGRHTAFDQYWGSTGFAGRQDGVFKVSCQEDQREWLESNGKKIAENMLVGVLGERVEVEFIVEE